MRHILLLTALLASPATAENVLQSHFGNDRLSGCFARNYTKAHLAEHPDQLVTSITVTTSARSDRGQIKMLDVFVMMRGDPYYYHAFAECKAKGDGLSCLLEGDAGGFTLTGAKKGALLLTVGRLGMGFEGDRFVEISGTRGDDRVFLIPNVDGDICN
jgi:hypothetical protein